MKNNEWKKVCAACAEGTPPKLCAYYGEPNGCNAPKTGQHPTAREELNKAANICLFVKENCGDRQTARYMAEAITAINEAVAQETAKVEQPGNAAAMREGLEWATSTIDVSQDVLDETEDWENEVVCWVRELQEKARAALAAPARNCDLYATAEDAYAAWMVSPQLTPICEWLLAPAEGGAE